MRFFVEGYEIEISDPVFHLNEQELLEINNTVEEILEYFDE